MKSLLEIVPEAYMRPEWAANEGRPWWASYQNRTQISIEIGFRRQGTDNIVAFKQGPGYTEYHIEPAEVDARMVETDLANPLPFPGIRAGQIWAVLFNAKQTIIGPLVGNEALPKLGSAADYALLHDPIFPECVPWSGKLP